MHGVCGHLREDRINFYTNMTYAMDTGQRVKASTRSVATMGDLLLKGYCMLAESCPECMVCSFITYLYYMDGNFGCPVGF